MSKIVENITSKQLKNMPNFSSGDTVVVSVKVKEGKRERIQAFEGVVISKKTEESALHSLLEKYLMARAWKEFSKHTVL